jgi:hypothetical protein
MANGDAISPREEIVAGEVGNEASWSGSRIHSIFFLRVISMIYKIKFSRISGRGYFNHVGSQL